MPAGTKVDVKDLDARIVAYIKRHGPVSMNVLLKTIELDYCTIRRRIISLEKRRIVIKKKDIFSAAKLLALVEVVKTSP